METTSFTDKNKKEVTIGDECIWENRIGEKKKGIFKGLEGISGQQASFLPEGETRIIYVSITQLYLNSDRR